MNRIRPLALTAAVLAATAAGPARAQEATYEGFLCCNLRTDGSWISDINYAESGKRVIPAGTPAKVTGYGRQRVHVEIDGRKQDIGNDYSRDLDLEAFARRYVVTEDPRPRLARYPARVREAIAVAKVMRGMTREQVLMSVGHPVTSENPEPDARTWRFWRNRSDEFQVTFDERGRVTAITTDPATRNLVVME